MEIDEKAGQHESRNDSAAAGFAMDLKKAVASVPFWWHSIDLGALTTPGGKNAELLRKEWETMRVPDIEGKTILDIGAWDGYFSFMAETHGAKAVTALDHYVWSIDRRGWGEYSAACIKNGSAPDPVETTPYWDAANLPGKKGFDLARTILKSRVRSIVADYMTVDPAYIGTFDIVFYLGVLYHMPNPLAALEKVAALTNTLAIIETHATEVYGHGQPLAEFYPTSELNGDPSNWWGPNIAALVGLCKAAGFRRVEVIKGPPKLGKLRSFAKGIASLLGIPWGRRHRHYRAVVHAWK